MMGSMIRLSQAFSLASHYILTGISRRTEAKNQLNFV